MRKFEIVVVAIVLMVGILTVGALADKSIAYQDRVCQEGC